MSMLIQTLVEQRLYNSKEFDKYLSERPCDTCPEGECGCSAPSEWMAAAGEEAYVAFTEALDTWVTTLIAGRPPTTPLVEWEHRELRDGCTRGEGVDLHGRNCRCFDNCIPIDDVKEVHG